MPRRRRRGGQRSSTGRCSRIPRRTAAGWVLNGHKGFGTAFEGLAVRIDAGDDDALQRSSVAKLLVSRAAITAVQTAVAALGNPGLTRGNPLERHLRDVLCSRPHPPQDDAALVAAGTRALARYRR